MDEIPYYYRFPRIERFLNEHIRVIKEVRERVKKIGGGWDDYRKSKEYDKLRIPFIEGIITIKRPWTNPDGTPKKGYEVYYTGKNPSEKEELIKNCLRLILR